MREVKFINWKYKKEFTRVQYELKDLTNYKNRFIHDEDYIIELFKKLRKRTPFHIIRTKKNSTTPSLDDIIKRTMTMVNNEMWDVILTDLIENGNKLCVKGPTRKIYGYISVKDISKEDLSPKVKAKIKVPLGQKKMWICFDNHKRVKKITNTKYIINVYGKYRTMLHNKNKSLISWQ